MLYGQFAEFMFEGIKGGLHAELIRNRSFEGPPNAIGISRYWERYPDDRNDDYAISFDSDKAVAYPRQAPSEGLITGHSLRVQIRPGVTLRHGVYQARIPITSGLDYRGYLWIRADSFKGDVRVALEADVTGGRIYDEAHIANVGGEWKQYPFTLRPVASDPLARFAILFTGEGTVWVDQVSLMPGNAVNGVRADVLDKVKALTPAFVRWPGGNVAQDYRWQWGIGPRDQRPTWINLSWKNEPEPGDFGTDEFIRVRARRRRGALHYRQRRGPRCDGGGGRGVGRGTATGRQRRGTGRCAPRNGHSEPYRVKYWEIGNEIWGDWVRGHSDAATYARNLTRYVAAMRAVDPAIQVIAVGDNDMAWNRTVLQLAGEAFDYLAVHHYYSHRDMDADLRNLMARPLHYERLVRPDGGGTGQPGPGAPAQAGDQRVGPRRPRVAAALDPRGALRGAADERLRAARRPGRDERRVRPRQRLAWRPHSGEPTWRVRHADLPGQQPVCGTPRRNAAGGDS